MHALLPFFKCMHGTKACISFTAFAVIVVVTLRVKTTVKKCKTCYISNTVKGEMFSRYP